jgi:Raf kinase inhibitor-like YbhB/YbcL family protein
MAASCLLATQGVAVAADFRVTSTDVGAVQGPSSERTHAGANCSGGNQSPAVSWSGYPAGAKSFVVTLVSEIPGDRYFWHWLMMNIPSSTSSLGRDAGRADGTKTPSGAAQLVNGFQTVGYGGPCPIAGGVPQKYVLTVYALSIESLPVPANGDPAVVLKLIQPVLLGQAKMTY